MKKIKWKYDKKFKQWWEADCFLSDQTFTIEHKDRTDYRLVREHLPAQICQCVFAREPPNIRGKCFVEEEKP